MPKRMPGAKNQAPAEALSPESPRAPGEPPPDAPKVAQLMIEQGFATDMAAATREVQAMEVLARHVARLGNEAGGAGRSLEEAVRKVVQRAEGVAAAWAFLDGDECGWEAYRQELDCFDEVFQADGNKPAADSKVLRHFFTGLGTGTFPDAVLPPEPKLLSSRDNLHGDMDIAISDICFAHDSQSELFGGGRARDGGDRPVEQRGILQLAVELASGLKAASDLPPIHVCVHEDAWYCRSGHRRLAALRLARRWAPLHVSTVRAHAEKVDEAFIRGLPGRQPKLTTHKNGAECRGRWLVIRETTECVGREAAASPEFGADLMNLLAPLFARARAPDDSRRGVSGQRGERQKQGRLGPPARRDESLSRSRGDWRRRRGSRSRSLPRRRQ